MNSSPTSQSKSFYIAGSVWKLSAIKYRVVFLLKKMRCAGLSPGLEDLATSELLSYDELILVKLNTHAFIVSFIL